ncbi:hypothetical protein M5K25_026338 [Dendrobium thyrsiflorum]|uniref:Uncharacterized protein n=1 Tax=Dendrobium thyrsiflorum TaxID=117978 RepID=A0ABD0TX75_DENTH
MNGARVDWNGVEALAARDFRSLRALDYLRQGGYHKQGREFGSCIWHQKSVGVVRSDGWKLWKKLAVSGGLRLGTWPNGLGGVGSSDGMDREEQVERRSQMSDRACGGCREETKKSRSRALVRIITARVATIEASARNLGCEP